MSVLTGAVCGAWDCGVRESNPPPLPHFPDIIFLCVSTLFISLFTKYTSVWFMRLLLKAQSNPKGSIEVHEVIYHRTEFRSISVSLR